MVPRGVVALIDFINYEELSSGNLNFLMYDCNYITLNLTGE